MHQKTILCLITILMSGIPYAQAGRPSSTPQPAAPANVPNPTPASPSPANTPTSSDTPPSADTNSPQNASFISTPLGKTALLGTGVALTGLTLGMGIKYGLKEKKAVEETTQNTTENMQGFVKQFENPKLLPHLPQTTEAKAYQILDKEQFNAAVKMLSDTAKLIAPTNPDQQQANKHQAYKAELDRALGHLQKVTDHEAEHQILATSLKILYSNVIHAHGFQSYPSKPFTEHCLALKALHDHYEALRPLK
jgi:hypothetical protein